MSISNGGRKDVVIRPGPAVVSALSKGVHRQDLRLQPTAEEENQILKAEMADLSVQVEQSRNALELFALACLCFIRIMTEKGILREGQDTVVLPCWMVNEMQGYSVTMTRPTASDDVRLRIRERAPVRYQVNDN